MASSGSTQLLNNIDPRFRSVFQYDQFNQIQAASFADLYGTDKSVIVCAPTGSGKTVLFELAIVKLLRDMQEGNCSSNDAVIIYVSPTKALCQERVGDWKNKFERFGVTCVELTGDVDIEEPELRFDVRQMPSTALIMCCTPEKLDSKSRLVENHAMFERCALCCIDEVHVLNEGQRGATLETVITRLKTTIKRPTVNGSICRRFVVVSATTPNVGDIAEWLSFAEETTSSVSTFSFGNSERQVPIQKVVMAFDFRGNLFTFDRFLTYKLPAVIDQYSNGKPTLIFCATRSGAQWTCKYLASSMKLKLREADRTALSNTAKLLRDNMLRAYVANGFAFHHAGLHAEDRQAVERVFRDGHLKVVVATSGLSVGVNFPAHLVIIKCTSAYVNGSIEELTLNAVLQMVGRAGRPQFDHSGVAVIMTTKAMKWRYDRDWNDMRVIDSALHNHAVEHLNAEVVLGNIRTLADAVSWMKSTFLYTRLCKNSAHYGLKTSLGASASGASIHSAQIEAKMKEWCLNDISKLRTIGAITTEPLHSTDAEVQTTWRKAQSEIRMEATEVGKIMSRFYVQFDTMSSIVKLHGGESIIELLQLVSGCGDFDMQLRQAEKKFLNQLNAEPKRASKKSKAASSTSHETTRTQPDEESVKPIRFRLDGRVKNAAMKTNCLLQCTLEGYKLDEDSCALQNEQLKAVRVACRLTRCIVEFLSLFTAPCGSLPTGITRKHVFFALCNAIRLHKSLRCELWYDAPYVSLQVKGVRLDRAHWIISHGLTSWHKIAETDISRLQVLVGNVDVATRLLQFARALPRYRISVPEVDSLLSSGQNLLHLDLVSVRVSVDNAQRMSGHLALRNVFVVIGNLKTKSVLLITKLRSSFFNDSNASGDARRYVHTFSLRQHQMAISDLEVHVIDDGICGVDQTWSLRTATVGETGLQFPTSNQDSVLAAPARGRRRNNGSTESSAVARKAKRSRTQASFTEHPDARKENLVKIINQVVAPDLTLDNFDEDEDYISAAKKPHYDDLNDGLRHLEADELDNDEAMPLDFDPFDDYSSENMMSNPSNLIVRQQAPRFSADSPEGWHDFRRPSVTRAVELPSVLSTRSIDRYEDSEENHQRIADELELHRLLMSNLF